MIEKVIMETTEGEKIDLLKLEQGTYGRFFADEIVEGNDAIAYIILTEMKMKDLRWWDKF